ncbi:MAG: hypothetical protein Q6373_022005 [Candidatus Sigynarchaeota archaeon]
MESSQLSSAFKWNRIALVLLLAGAAAIYAEIAIKLAFIYTHTILDVVPADFWLDPRDAIYWILVPAIGIPAIALLYFTTKLYFKYQVKVAGITAAVSFGPASLAINASLLFGGGWYAGTIMADAGLIILLASFVMLEKAGKPEKTVVLEGKRKSQVRNLQAIVLALGCAGIVISAVVPVIAGINAIPEPLVPAATSLPSVAPNHENTFYIMPIWETAVTNYTLGNRSLEYMKRAVGGNTYTGTGFVKIGRSLSCWYTNDIYDNGSYNPTNLIHALNLANQTNTPILFHMNGGNWGQGSSTNPVILDMRSNVSNCQWDQNNWCPPIKYNNGPNDRFWSFWPGSEWEQFRERNIKQALAIIHAWWLNNPGLLVGFSTDSEIHLNYGKFTDAHPIYRSYFDYNPGTIAQYRQWAMANWTLQAFNKKCGTNFATWNDVDAPRTSADGVGVKGNPWWETWTDFRIWHVAEAGKRQCKWINESGFPREMIWHHQIFSKPGDEESRYVRCDPLQTAINSYCKVGVTRYDWISPKDWHSLGQLALNDGSGDTVPSWGIFEWNLWTQHEYWAYKEMLNCIYQYGGHVICPNEWTNCSGNPGLWIPGDPCVVNDTYTIGSTTYGDPDTGCGGTPEQCCCTQRYDNGTCKRCIDPHGNPQFLAALRDFVAEAQLYERGTCPTRRVNKLDVWFYDNYLVAFDYFSRTNGLVFMACCWFSCMILFFVTIGVTNHIRWSRRP